eukprot:2740879-Heterocapsa_arctica.AAC.1
MDPEADEPEDRREGAHEVVEARGDEHHYEDAHTSSSPGPHTSPIGSEENPPEEVDEQRQDGVRCVV